MTPFDIFSRVQNKLATIFKSVTSYFRHMLNLQKLYKKAMSSPWKKFPRPPQNRPAPKPCLEQRFFTRYWTDRCSLKPETGAATRRTYGCATCSSSLGRWGGSASSVGSASCRISTMWTIQMRFGSKYIGFILLGSWGHAEIVPSVWFKSIADTTNFWPDPMPIFFKV